MAVIGISVWSMSSERRNIIVTAERQSAGYVQALAEHSESALGESDRVLIDVLKDFSRSGGIARIERRQMYEIIHRQAEKSPQVGSLFVIDAKGEMIANSLEYPGKKINVADREYFRLYQSVPAVDLTISKPVMSRLVNRWRFNLIRPLNQPGEQFAGLLAVAFEVEYFKRFLTASSIGPRGRVALVRTDGAPLVFEPEVPNVYSTNFLSNALFQKKLPASPAGTYHSRENSVDQEPRIISYRRLARFPVVAVVSFHLDDVVAPWWNKAILQASLTLALCVVIIILTRFIMLHLNRLQAAQQVVEKQQATLKLKAAQIDAALDVVLMVDTNGILVQFNQALCQLTGYSNDELTGMRLQDLVLPEFSPRVLPNIAMLRETGQATFESGYLAKDGSRIPTEVYARTIESEGELLILSIARDISSRKRIELREQTRQKILEELATGAALNDLLVLIVSFVEQECPGATCSILLADETGAHLLHGAAPGLPDTYNEAVNGLKIRDGMGSCGTAAHRRKRIVVEDIEGHPYWKGFKPVQEIGMRACWSEPILASNGELLGTFAMYFPTPRSPGNQDLLMIESAAHLASIAIGRSRSEDKRNTLELQLRHMQKIEAIGQLAGGIAHDFNNLLTPIIIYADMLKKSFQEDQSQCKKIEGIISAANKAKDLTQKLLSCGRKQLLCMESLDLNEVIISFQDILRRTIRESIVIDIQLSPMRTGVLADRGQLEQILLNLAVNAKDAINGNGKVRIETGHVIIDDEFVKLHAGMKPGPYILLAFSDNGCGMEDDVLLHIFEPFFTTKAIGHGTGLGLATVFGIIKQHEGYIKVHSRVGEGTSFTVYLPEHAGDMSGTSDTNTAASSLLREQTNGTVLVVDDNEMVREMAAELLKYHGYTVLVAESPAQAMGLASLHPGSIDLLVTDVVMPEINGPELYERLAETYASLPVLYISGYTYDVVLHKGSLAEEVSFLSKPFTSEQFIDRVRHAMNNLDLHHQ
jgi:PAS domain S-box-containing protein